MSLNWNMEKVENFKELTEGEAWTITDVLIWGTMFTGIREITAENAKEFHARMNLVERLNGAMMNAGGKPRYITLEDIQRRIGLSTNATTMTRNQFIKTKTQRHFDELTK